MLTCLCDAFYGEVGIATLRILEHVGCEVVFQEEQTCCGQPAFNAGDWSSARNVANYCSEIFSEAEWIVVPSASCAAMLVEGYESLKVEFAPQVYELSQFLIEVCKVEAWPQLQASRTVAFHRSCHGRMLHLGDVQEKLLKLVPNLTLLPFAQSDQCCGFGGAFSASHRFVSQGIGTDKINQIVESGATEVVSGDMGCLMHLEGLAKKSGRQLKTTHYACLLSEAL